MEEHAEFRAHIQQMAEKLREIQRELEALRESIPPTLQELAEDDLPLRPDVPTELRGVLATVTADHLGPAIRSLFAAARYRLDGER